MTWLDEIKARLEAATPGPWQAMTEITYPVGHTPLVCRAVGPRYFEHPGKLHEVWAKADSKLIASAPTDIKNLLEAIRVKNRCLSALKSAYENDYPNDEQDYLETIKQGLAWEPNKEKK